MIVLLKESVKNNKACKNECLSESILKTPSSHFSSLCKEQGNESENTNKKKRKDLKA